MRPRDAPRRARDRDRAPAPSFLVLLPPFRPAPRDAGPRARRPSRVLLLLPRAGPLPRFGPQPTRSAMGFAEHFIGVDDDAKCAIYCSSGWEAAPKVLLVLQNAVGSCPGVWSRSLCISHGLAFGSMIPCLERALGEG